MKIRQFSSTALCLALGLLWACAGAPAHAVPMHIVGRVVDATNNSSPPGLGLKLMRPAGNAADARGIAATVTDASGHFDFGRLDLAPDDLLIVRATWSGYDYDTPAYDGAGRLRSMGLNVDPANVLLKVFDTSATAPPLVATVHHIAIETSDRDLKCTERIVLENPSLTTYIGAPTDHVTVKLILPAGAHDVALDPSMSDAQLVKEPYGYGLVKPITPVAFGSRNAIVLSYLMSWPRSTPWNRKIDLSRKLIYPTRFFFVNRTEKDRPLQVIAPRLSADQDQQIPIDDELQTRIVNTIGNPMGAEPALPAGSVISVKVSRAINPLIWAFVAFVILLCVMVPLLLWKGWSGEPGKPLQNDLKIEEPTPTASVYGGISPGPAVIGQTRRSVESGTLSAVGNELIQKIARLDEAWEAGLLDAEVYQTQRGAWKAKLIESMGSPNPES